MSRSYKKNPGWSGSDSKNWLMKRLANKKVRKTKFVANGGAYKKVFLNWNTYSYSFRCHNKKEAIKELGFWEKGIYRSWMK